MAKKPTERRKQPPRHFVVAYIFII
ncbi:hypothetical protein J001_03945 [Cryptococcus neoformans]|nr:hypothetical protein J001_03945 [Cryptococcus neoformans var. grubii]